MKRILFILLLVGGLHLTSAAQYDSINYNGTFRTYLLHIPAAYVPGVPMPLVLAMHGGFGSGPQLESQSELSSKADSAGFIVVYPEGVKGPLGIRTWNAGGCCGYAMSNNVDDVGFLSALIDTLQILYTIDADRIYATGMSNGAFMSYRLACELSSRIAAIGPVAGTMNVSLCNPARGVPVIHFHSYLDTNVPFTGGIGSGVSDHYNPPVDSVLNVWAGYSHCQVAEDTLHVDTDYTHIVWQDCDCGNEMELYVTQDGGHSWPGGNASPIGDSVSKVINADDLMWTFFEQHPLTCITGIEESEQTGAEVHLDPNPFTGQSIMRSNTPLQDASFSIFNAFGQQVMESDHLWGNNVPIKRGNLPAGHYILQLMENGKVVAMQAFVITD